MRAVITTHPTTIEVVANTTDLGVVITVDTGSISVTRALSPDAARDLALALNEAADLAES